MSGAHWGGGAVWELDLFCFHSNPRGEGTAPGMNYKNGRGHTHTHGQSVYGEGLNSASKVSRFLLLPGKGVGE